MTYNLNCRYFRGDKPCYYHKLHHVTCGNCEHYADLGPRVLIIKLDAIGDVLRTTCILPALKRKYPDSTINWITRKESTELLVNNPYLHRVIQYESDALATLLVENFDIAINTSNDTESATLTRLANAKYKIGYSINENGAVFPLSEESEYYLTIGINDDLKKANKKTYQQMMFEMLNLEYNSDRPVLELTRDEINFAKRFSHKHNIKNTDLVIGLNTNAGARWQLKTWPIEKTIRLAGFLYNELHAKTILFAGPNDFRRSELIISKSTVPLIDAGCNNSLREFASLINLTNVLVTSDTLALHIGTALKKKIVALFGPTSHTEIDLYGQGIKVFSDIDCLCCYNEKCDKNSNCMERISVNQVMTSIKTLLE